MTATTNHTRTWRPPAGMLTRLRDMCPIARRLNWHLAERLAASQAAYIATCAGRAGLSVDHYVALLPAIRLERVAEMPVPVASLWDGRARQWVIHVRSTEPVEDQRHAILREFKHILDRPMTHRLYGPGAPTCHQRARQAAEDFATSALMPASQMRSAAQSGLTDPIELAARFNVSPPMAARRLAALGLDKCSPSSRKRQGGPHHA